MTTLEARLASLPAPETLTSLADQAADAALRSRLMGQIQAIEQSRQILSEDEQPLEADKAHLPQLIALYKALEAELLTLEKPRTTLEHGRKQNLVLSMAVILRGREVITDTGYTYDSLEIGKRGLAWRGSRGEVEARIAERQQRVDNARARLEYALLDDDARAQRDAEHQDEAREYNALPKRVKAILHARSCGRPGAGVGAVVLWKSYTAEQRKALLDSVT